MNTEQFFDFELKNGLFDIVDSRGLRPWEAVRYYVYSRIYSNREISQTKTNKGQGLLKKIIISFRNKVHFINYVLKHKNSPYMFLLSSRDKNGGLYYDKIGGNLFERIDKSKTFAFESCMHNEDYKYEGMTCENSFMSLLENFVTVTYDFSYLQNLINTNYPGVPIRKNEMEKWYRRFLSQYLYFKIIFRFCSTERMFMVQNGILKGVFAAANEMGVEVIEFQHGQISLNHPAYSYPSDNKVDSTKIYHPSTLLVFGDFWTKNRYYPGVENVVVGNDFYYKIDRDQSIQVPKRFLVISDKYEGKRLVNYVKSILDLEASFSFYFKLHPNQYKEFDVYKNEFRTYENVEVVSDSMTISELLSKSEGILVVQSTVELEALRDGKKVFVVEEGAYEMMDFVFKEPGVYLINSASDFIVKYEHNINEIVMPRNDLFEKYKDFVVEKYLDL